MAKILGRGMLNGSAQMGLTMYLPPGARFKIFSFTFASTSAGPYPLIPLNFHPTHPLSNWRDLRFKDTSKLQVRPPPGILSRGLRKEITEFLPRSDLKHHLRLHNMIKMTSHENVVLVTGAAQGIGQAIAVKFAEAKYKVALLDIVEPKKTLKKIAAVHGDSNWFEVDISNELQVQEAIEAILEKWGKINVLINNAGIFPIELFQEMSVDLFRRVFEINVVGTFICSRSVVKQFLSKKLAGSIINIASVGGIREELYHSHYSASKAAVISLTKSMAMELGMHGIRVNAIAPGAISTKGARTATPFMESGNIPEDFMAFQTKKRSPLGKMGDPEDVAQMAYYLASDNARYITGAVIVVDGGRSLQ